MALVDCLDIMPEDHPDRPQMLTILSNIATALQTYQDPNGMFWQVVDKKTSPGNWVESSCTAMFSYALGRAVEQGYLPADPYLAMSQAALNALVAHKLPYSGGYISLRDTATVGSLSGYSSYSAGYAYYTTGGGSGKTINDFKGVGALMRAALQYEKPITSP